MASGTECETLEVGVFLPERTPKNELDAGEIGYVATGLKDPEKVRVGDTITTFKRLNIETLKSAEPLSGYREPTPMVYASIFPENQDEYEMLRDSFKKLKLNDAAIYFEPENASPALGRGFRAGFLGMLHMEIVAERLSREYGLKLIFSNPSVAFRIHPARSQLRRGVRAAVPLKAERTSNVAKKDSGEVIIYSAAKMPNTHEIEAIEEPWTKVEIIMPPRFLGALSALIHEHAGKITDTSSIGGDKLKIKFEAPLREIIIDFYDRLKSVTQGFASMAYELVGWKKADLIKLDILVAGEKTEALAEIVPREKVYHMARERLLKLKEVLPRELFAVALQAEIEGRIIARETIPAVRKDVTGYLYGGDRTRKMKLWKKQQKGKKRLKETGHVEIPAEVFLKMLKK